VAARITYSITDLGTLGGANSVPLWVTNTGEVVGYSDTGEFDGSGLPIDHAFRWSKGVMQDLGTLGGNNSLASGVNSEGEIAGLADVTGGATSHAALWYKGTVTDLGTLTGASGFSQAQLVNSAHQVAGGSTLADGTFHAVQWQRGAMTDLGTLGGPNSYANGINDLGQIVGISQVNDVPNPILGFPPFQAAIWYRGTIIDLGPGPENGIGSAGFNINNRGQAVGRFALPDPVEGAVAHAFLWESGVMHDLGVPAGLGDDNSEANSLNDSGKVVGDSGVGFIESYTPNRALLWESGPSIDLNTLIAANSGYQLTVAFDVNSRGQIAVCAVEQSTGNIHALLLTPQPSNVSKSDRSLSPLPSHLAPPLSPDASRLLEHARRTRSGGLLHRD
jgi:probable HAF family extracellular repeat protein